jgi:hypothetical protein
VNWRAADTQALAHAAGQRAARRIVLITPDQRHELKDLKAGPVQPRSH